MDILDTIKKLFLLGQNTKSGITLYTKKPMQGEIDLFQSFNLAVGAMRLEVSRIIYGGVLFSTIHARCEKGSLLLFVDGEWKNVGESNPVVLDIEIALIELHKQVHKRILTELHNELKSTDCMTNPNMRPVRAPVGPIGHTIYEGNVEEML